MDDCTALVKSLLRPVSLERLLASLRQYCPDLAILVADDGPACDREPVARVCDHHGARVLWLPHDVGLSVGRNVLVDACATPFFLLLDDDFVVLPDSHIPALVDEVRAGRFDIAAGTVLHWGQPTHYEGYMERQGRHLHMRPVQHPVTRPVAVDLAFNFFAARTEAVRRVRWHDALKLCEHQSFFLRCQRAGVRVGYVPAAQIDHRPQTEGDYGAYRKMRGNAYYQMFLESEDLEGILGTVAV